MPLYQLQTIVGYMAVLFKHLKGWSGPVCPNVLHFLDQKVKLKNALKPVYTVYIRRPPTCCGPDVHKGPEMSCGRRYAPQVLLECYECALGVL